MANIGKGVGKALLKSLKVFGLRPDDITDLLTEFELDSFIVNEIKEIVKKDHANNIKIIGEVNEKGKIVFSAIDDLGKTHSINFFGVQKNNFSITNLVTELVNLAFNSIEKENKKSKKKKNKK